MILAIEIPTEGIHKMYVVFSVVRLQIPEGIIDSIYDLEELLADTVLCLSTTTFKTTKVVSRLNLIVSESSLEPLD